MKNIPNAARARLGGWALGLALLLALAAGPALGQVLPTNPNGTLTNPAVPMVRPDTATVRKVTKKQKREQAAADSARRTEKLFGLRLTKAEKAGLLAIAPSGGQIYNKKYWKLPLVYGLVGGLGYWVFYQQRLYSDFRFANSAVDSAAINKGPISDKDLRAQLALAKVNNPTAITNGLISARRYRDLSILLSAVGYSLTALDAVVDAHLSDFDVSDDLSLHWQPAALPVPGQAAFAPGLMLTLHVRR
ncbi:MAG: DUF5683 domain-containing protein [Janthinobacterium lividum]